MVDSPQPANLSYLWNFGSLLGTCLILQILTGIFLAMHYIPNVDLAFTSVEHIMRDVNNGWAVRYTHANVASFFFIFVYAHIARGLYYGSYKSPRVLVWAIGVIILVVMMATAFLGYVLPYGQMSLWGLPKLAPNAFLIIDIILFSIDGCLDNISYTSLPEVIYYCTGSLAVIKRDLVKYDSNPKLIKLKAEQRIGPHNLDILCLIFGSLLGDAHAEYRGKGTRICFYQESKHSAYLMLLHNIISNLGYCNHIEPKIQKRLGKKGVVRNVVRFKTWTYSSFNWIHELWYKNNIKVVPLNISDYLTPIALAIWLMDDGSKSGSSLKLATNSFTFSECLQLVKVLYGKYNIKASIQSAGVDNQYVIYIFKESMPILRDLVLPYVHPSMKYKINY